MTAPKDPGASRLISEAIIAASIPADQLERLVRAYEAGRMAGSLKLRGLPFDALVKRWTNFTVPSEVQRQFWRGVDVEIPNPDAPIVVGPSS